MALRTHRRRTAGATVASLILHVLVLTGMVVGLKVAAPPPEDRAMDVRLIPSPLAQPRPERAQRAPSPSRREAPAPLRPHLTPAPSAPVPTTALPQAAPPAAAPRPVYGPQALQPSLSGRLGCDDPLHIHLTPDQAQVCANNLAAIARAAKPLELNISARNKADYDRKVHCQDVYTHAGMPSSGSRDPSGGSIAGLGYVPSFKECPPGDR